MCLDEPSCRFLPFIIVKRNGPFSQREKWGRLDHQSINKPLWLNKEGSTPIHCTADERCHHTSMAGLFRLEGRWEKNLCWPMLTQPNRKCLWYSQHQLWLCQFGTSLLPPTAERLLTQSVSPSFSQWSTNLLPLPSQCLYHAAFLLPNGSCC